MTLSIIILLNKHCFPIATADIINNKSAQLSFLLSADPSSPLGRLRALEDLPTAVMVSKINVQLKGPVIFH